VTRETHNVSPTGGCPDPALIAAHADHRLSGAEAARMDEHVAGCRDCYEVFAETVRFGLAEDEAGVARAGAPVVAPALFRRPLFKTAAALATAAVVLLALGLWFTRDRFRGAPAPLLAELAEAMGDRRFVQPRLTGGFRHGRLITLRSGDTSQGLDTQSPAVLGAVARIRERAEGDTSPEALGALGVTYLVSGDTSAAVKALESATAQDPKDPRLLSDLAAAYLVRAERADEPADIPKALESAERAVALENAPVEAWFNRALALERLHLTDATRKAWDDYLQRDSSSPWAEEARQHLEALPKEQKSSAEEDKARVRAALDEGPAATDRLADEAPHLLREYFEDELLPAWAEAHLAANPDVNLHAERAGVIGNALARTTGDAMARDAAEALTEPLDTRSRDPLRSQALGYRALREAKHLHDLQHSSCAAFRGALRELQAGGSPYSAWASQQVVGVCLLPAEQTAAVTELERLELLAHTHGYVQLLGRLHWLTAHIHAVRGELTHALERFRSAGECFRKTRDTENEAVILAMATECLQLLGDSRAAWRERQRALGLLVHVRSPGRRHGMLGEATFAGLDAGLPRAALHFGSVLVEAALAWGRPVTISDALVIRARIHHALDADDRAAADLIESRRWLSQISDRSAAAKQNAEIDAVEGAILTGRQPAEAARSLREALTYFQTTTPVRIPALHLLLARAHVALASDDKAESELLAGIEAMEGGRISLREAALQVSFFDQAFPLFDDMVRLQVTRRNDPDRALAFVERGRARQLVDSMAGAPGAPLDPEALRRELPERVTLVYYVSLDDRLFGWTLSREGSHFTERSLRSAELSRLVAAHRAAIEQRAPEALLRQAAARLYDELVRPFIPFIASQRALVFIPDGVLQSVPFASLWDRGTGRYLIEDYVLGVAPSGTTFVRASSGAAQRPHETALQALIVGNPRFDRRLWGALSDLPGAEAEAAEIAALYVRSELLIAGRATKTAFLERLRRSQVIHYAGHAASRADAPSAARLLFAPDARTGDSGALYLHELGRQGLPRTRVVVLAACRTGAGAVSRVEGALSLGRPFLATGVPDVVVSLWDIDDSLSRRFFSSFHAALLADGDPVVALRNAQIALLRGDDVSLAHPASWAAFICMGGLGPHSLSKGEPL
jgi:CHAT domain-containing protein/tetratricopeptide (TPR) repeat protein